MKLKIADGYVLIKPLEPLEDKTSQGVIIPKENTQIPQKGKIVGVGRDIAPDGKEVTPIYKEGDIIVFKKWDAYEYKPEGIGGEKYLFVKHPDVLAIDGDKK